MGGGSLVPYLVVLQVAMPYSWRYFYSRWISSEVDATWQSDA